MTKIGILSDTHIKNITENFSNFYFTHFEDMDLIVHAGDFSSDAAIGFLSEKKRLLAVLGNNDTQVTYPFNEKEIIAIEGYKIGIYHGHGKSKNTEQRSIEKFKNDDVDIIIFGHSHQPLIKTQKGILLLNPGSPSAKRKEKWYSYIILNIKEDHIGAELKFFQNKLL